MKKCYNKKEKLTTGYTRTLTFKNRRKLVCGYTIIETMIALAIFLIVIVVGIGALLNAHLVNRKSQDMRSIMDSLSYSMEDMSRNIRTGSNYKCLRKWQEYNQSQLDNPPSDCVDGYGIAFESSKGEIGNNTDQWVYYIEGGQLFRSTTGLADYVQMTPSEVVLDKDSYSFSVIGVENNDKQQPLVIIRLVGKIIRSGEETSFSLQTAVSQRLIDN